MPFLRWSNTPKLYCALETLTSAWVDIQIIAVYLWDTIFCNALKASISLH